MASDRGYNLLEIPASPGRGSRFFLPRTTGGFDVDPGVQLGDSFAMFLAARKHAAKSIQPPTVTVKLKMAVASGDGEWVLQDRGEVSGPQTHENVRPTRIGQLKKLKDGDLLDSVALGGEAYEKATDAEIWEALRAVCESHNLNGNGWRRLNDSVCRLVALRAGLAVGEEQLPHPFRMPERPSSNPTKQKGGSHATA